MTTRRVPLCQTKGCPTRRKDFKGDPNDWHIPWCGHGLEGHHHHVKKRSQGGTKGDIVFICPGCHRRIDEHHWGNAVLDILGVGRVYRVWDHNNRTVFEHIIEAGPEDPVMAAIEESILDPPARPEPVEGRLPAVKEPAREQLAQASAKGRQALELAGSVPEVKDLRDRAEALRMYAQACGLGLQAQNEMADIKIRAERKAGQLLKVIEREPGKRKGSTSYQAVIRLVGIDSMMAHRWQLEAELPNLDYEAYAQTCNQEGIELTTAGILRLIRAMQREGEEPEPPCPNHEDGKHRFVCACGKEKG